MGISKLVPGLNYALPLPDILGSRENEARGNCVEYQAEEKSLYLVNIVILKRNQVVLTSNFDRGFMYLLVCETPVILTSICYRAIAAQESASPLKPNRPLSAIKAMLAIG